MLRRSRNVWMRAPPGEEKESRRSRNVWMRDLQEKKDAVKVTQRVNACPPGEERAAKVTQRVNACPPGEEKTSRRSRNV